MSTFLKLAFAALILNACVQAGSSAWTFYQFEDKVQQTLLFSSRMTPEQVKTRMMALASEFEVPLAEDTVEVTYVQTQARVKGSYTDDVTIIPRGYVYKWTHALDLDVRRVPY